MNNATIDMKMPTNYVDMSTTEIQFDGGWNWKTFLAATAVVGAVAFAVGTGLLVGGGVVALSEGGGALSSKLVTSGVSTMAVGSVLGIGGFVGTMVAPDN